MAAILKIQSPSRTEWSGPGPSTIHEKTHVGELAVFGGAPAFAEPLHVGRPNVGDRERLMARLNDLLDRRWFSNDGPYVKEFEQRIAELTGAKHAVAMTNATIALEIAIRATGLSGEVIVPSFTFVATAHALQWQEITPVFCDVDPLTHNIDPAQVERLITPKTSGIIGVHLWGRPCAIEELSAVAEKHHLRLLFDAAHAVGCSYKGRMIGGFGDAEVFSFHATKFLNSFEGGALVTNDDDIAGKARLMKNFGFTNYDQVIYLGTNGKMTEPAAAMGLTSLESLEDFVAVNRVNYRQYQHELAGIPGITLARYPDDERTNFQYVILEVDESQTNISRDLLVKVLHAEQVLARRYFYPGVHRMEPYRSYFPNAGLLLPHTERLSRQVMSLPTGTGVDGSAISAICSLLRLAVANGSELTSRLPKPLPAA